EIRRTRRAQPQFAREEWHDHRLPFRPFCLMRSDELDRVVVSGKPDGAWRRKIVAQLFGELCQDHSVRFRFRRLCDQGIKFAREIAKLRRRQWEQTLAQLRLLDDQSNGVK